jgi:hypothetical protein
MTGLALLCFLGYGQTPDSQEFGLTVAKGFKWLVDNGLRNQGRLSMTPEDWGPGNAGVYEHGIATYALGEYVTMTASKDQEALDLLKMAVTHIIKGQGPDGGWMYSFDKTQSDTSVSGWQIQALKAAYLAKAEIPGVDTALDKAMKNLERVQDSGTGAYGYRKSGAGQKWSLTGVGVLCSIFWTGDRDRMVRKGADFIMDKAGKEEPIVYQDDKADLYAWYYHSQAMLMFGGDGWRKWNRLFQDELIKAQSADGSWPVMKSKAHGALQTDGSVTGAVYRSTLCILMLEVFYRYMPTNKGER